MPKISASVGSRGSNKISDVKVVQTLLNKWQDDIVLERPLLVDGLAGRKTMLAIIEFQGRVAGLSSPDGRVDPDGLTLKILNQVLKAFKILPQSGRSYYTYGRDEKRFGSPSVIASVKQIASSLHSMGITIGIGNISLKEGGRMRPHSSHQRGVDVDFRPLRKDKRQLPTNIHSADYSRSLTEKLISAIRDDVNLDLILFNDPDIPGIKYWSGHDNHIHVRFKK
jgi:hypothetical protein